MRLIKILFAFVITSIFFTTSVYAESDGYITVGKGQDYENFEDAVEASKEGDTIIVFPGEYGVPYNEAENSYITLDKDNVSIIGVDENGETVKTSDDIKVTLYPKMYEGTVEARAFIYIKGKNVSLDGIIVKNYVEDMPNTSIVGEGGSINHYISMQADEFYPETKFVKLEPDYYPDVNTEEIYNEAIANSQIDPLDEPPEIVNIQSSKPSVWAEEAYDTMNERNLVPSALNSDHQDYITRAEFAALLTTVYEDVEEVIYLTDTPFTDINGHYYEYQLNMAASAGLMNGTSETTMSPDDPLTREQGARLLGNLIYLIEDVEFENYSETAEKFADDQDISSWAKDSVYYEVDKGIVSGVGNNYFSPKSYLTREQAVVMVYNVFEVYGW